MAQNDFYRCDPTDKEALEKVNKRIQEMLPQLLTLNNRILSLGVEKREQRKKHYEEKQGEKKEKRVQKEIPVKKERAQKTQRLLSNFLRFQEDENHMCEMLLSNEQLIEGSPALQEVVSLCDGLDKDEYSVVIERVNKRVQSVVDKLVESLQEATMTNDVPILHILHI